MAQQNCKDLKPTDTLCEVPTFTKASCDHALDSRCAHNLFSIQVSQETSSNSLVVTCPNSGEHLLQEPARDLREKDCPVHWYKLIAPMIPKNMTTGSSVPEPTPVHVAYSPLASMNHQWTINVHDEYPLSMF